MLQGWREHRKVSQVFQTVPNLARIADAYRIAGQPFDGFADILAPDRARYDRLDIRNIESVTGGSGTVDINVDIAPTGQSFRQGRTDTFNLFGRALDFLGDLVNCIEIITRHLDPDRAFDPGREHFDTVADRRYPEIGQSGNLDGFVELLDQLVRRHAGAPFLLRFEMDRCLEHGERRRIGRCIGPTSLAEHCFHFGHRFYQPIGLLKQFGGFGRRYSRQGIGHV